MHRFYAGIIGVLCCWKKLKNGCAFFSQLVSHDTLRVPQRTREVIYAYEQDKRIVKPRTRSTLITTLQTNKQTRSHEGPGLNIQKKNPKQYNCNFVCNSHFAATMNVVHVYHIIVCVWTQSIISFERRSSRKAMRISNRSFAERHSDSNSMAPSPHVSSTDRIIPISTTRYGFMLVERFNSGQIQMPRRRAANPFIHTIVGSDACDDQ